MKERISSFQTFWLSLVIVLPTLVLLVPRFLADMAGQMGWLSVIVAGFSIGLLHYIILKLSFDFSNESIVYDCQKLFGSILGRIIILPFLIVIIDTASVVALEVVKFMRVIMPQMEMTLFWISFGLMAIYLTSVGIEAIARLSQLVMVIVIPFILLMILFMLICCPEIIDVEKMKPIIFDLKAIIKGSILPANWFIEIPTVLLILKSFFKAEDKIIKVSLLANLTIQIFVIILFIFSIIILGVELTAHLNFPLYIITTLSVRGFEVAVFVAWLLANMLKIGIYYFSSTKLIGDYFGLKSYKGIIVPTAILITISSIFRAEFPVAEFSVKYAGVGYLIIGYIPIIILLSLAYFLKSKPFGNN